jgi:hypothetical protein
MDEWVEMMDLEFWKQYRGEMIREAEHNRLARELRAARNKRAGAMKRWRASSPEESGPASSGLWDDPLMGHRRLQ